MSFTLEEVMSIAGLCTAARKLSRALDAIGINQNPQGQIEFLKIEVRVNEEWQRLVAEQKQAIDEATKAANAKKE